MKLANLQLQNWLLFREADLSFTHAGSVIGIVGQFAEEQARSNRSGKSTIPEAIRYLFYGKGRSGQQVNLINRTAREDGEDMTVSGLAVLHDGRELRITRGRTYDNKPILDIENLEGEKVKDADRYLAELIGFEYDEYTSTCFFEQGDIHRFMLARPAEKRELIQRWLRQERWAKRCSFSDMKLKELRSEAEGLRIALQSLPEGSGGHSVAQLKAILKEAERKHDTAKERLDSALKAKEGVTLRATALNAVGEAMDRLERLQGDLTKAREKLQTARKKSKARQKARAVRERKQAEYEKQRDLVELERRVKGAGIANVEAQRDANEAKLKRLSKLSGVCPFLEEECGRVDTDSLVPLREEGEGIKRHLTTLKGELAKYVSESSEGLSRLQTAVKKAQRQLDDNEYPKLSHFKERIDDLKSREAELGEAIGDHTREGLEAERDELAETITSYGKRVTRARELETEAATDLGIAKTQLTEAKRAAKRRTELTAKLRQAEEDSAGWAYCKYMFGPRGIPGAIMETNFATLETDINFILERMNTDLSVKFQPYRETQKWESLCLECGARYEKSRARECEKCGQPRQRKRVDQLILQVVDQYEGQVSDFGMDSGGGKTLLSFAVRLALMFLKVRENTGDIPPIVLDEVLSSLDPINRVAVLDLVQNVLVARYGVQQVFMISHQPEIQDSVEDVLVVTRHNFHSTVAWA